jgi:4-carboxymuconolactone decarboxylase
MAVTDAAHKNHEELFPNYKSQLKDTDPELIEIFDNFAFDKVVAQTKLDSKTRLMLILAAIIGSQAHLRGGACRHTRRGGNRCCPVDGA